MIQPLEAVILGIVEGLTEFLPVSSTGHLILVAHALGLEGEGTKTFEIVIQAGAVAAVCVLYRGRVLSLLRGLAGRDPRGSKLLLNLCVSFLPAALCGLLLHRWVKEYLFGVRPVIWALALGGAFMIAASRLWARREARGSVETMNLRMALCIGLAQCLSLWPGTSRSMVTILGGMFAGLGAKQAAEYSFLLALPTLGAATLFDLVQGGGTFLKEVGPVSLALGFFTSFIVASLAIAGFVRYLVRHGLEPFGWYRIALSLVIWIIL